MSYANYNTKTQLKAKSQSQKPKAQSPEPKTQSPKPKAKSQSKILAPKCNKKHANRRFSLQNAANSKENCPKLKNKNSFKNNPKNLYPPIEI